MSAEGLAGTIFAMLALDASTERIIRIIERALDEERAAERARCQRIISEWQPTVRASDMDALASALDQPGT